MNENTVNTIVDLIGEMMQGNRKIDPNTARSISKSMSEILFGGKGVAPSSANQVRPQRVTIAPGTHLDKGIRRAIYRLANRGIKTNYSCDNFEDTGAMMVQVEDANDVDRAINVLSSSGYTVSGTRSTVDGVMIFMARANLGLKFELRDDERDAYASLMAAWIIRGQGTKEAATSAEHGILQMRRR